MSTTTPPGTKFSQVKRVRRRRQFVEIKKKTFFRKGTNPRRGRDRERVREHLGVVPAQNFRGDVVQAAHVLVELLVFLGELDAEPEINKLLAWRAKKNKKNEAVGM